MDILQELQNRILFCDGGMGSLLQEAGLKPGELPGTWNITHPEELVKIHKAYLEAGADIVTTNTFGVDRLKTRSFSWSRSSGRQWRMRRKPSARVESRPGSAWIWDRLASC